jgi:transcription antitermination factor NusG
VTTDLSHASRLLGSRGRSDRLGRQGQQVVVFSSVRRGTRQWDPGVKTTDRDFLLREGERWFVAQTLYHREKLASLHLTAQNFRIFLPQFSKTVRHARKLREAIVPVFPGYIFIALDIERDRWRSINGTIGVAHVLCAEGCPIPVPMGVVEAFICCLDDAGLVRFDSDLSLGQSVSVVAGPFARTKGVLERLDGNGRVRVLLEIMGGAVSVAMDSAQLTAS